MWVVPVPAHHDLGAGAVVGHEEHDRVLQRAHRAQLVQDAADLAVHPVDHRGVDRHLLGLEAPLLLVEALPRNGPVDLARPQLRDAVRKRVRRADILVQRRQLGARDPHRELAGEPFLTQPIPSRKVAIAIAGDILGRGVQWEVGRVKRQVLKEGALGVLRGVLLQAFDRMVSRHDGQVRASLGLEVRQLHAILVVPDEVEEAGSVSSPVGVVKPVVERIPVHVPLARMV